MRPLAVLLITALLAPACASVRTTGPNQAPTAPSADLRMLQAYVQKLPTGARVRASLVGGGTVRGTLIDATDTAIIIQRRTRIPEPPVAIPTARLRAVEMDAPGGGVGKTVAIGAAAGAGAAVGVLMLLIAMFSD